MPRIPKQIQPSEIDNNGLLTSPMHIKVKDKTYVQCLNSLGEGSSGEIRIVQLIKDPAHPELVGTFMTMKTYHSQTGYERAIDSFTLQGDIVYEGVEVMGEACIFRPFVYGEALSEVLFKNEKKQALSFHLQLNMAIAILSEISTRFEEKKLVHRALKPENIIWDIETKKATVIDEEDVAKTADPRNYYYSHSTLYRPAEIRKTPYSPAGDRYSVGIILAEIFLTEGMHRQAIHMPIQRSGHIANYFYEVIDTTTTEGLIRKEIQNLNRRLIHLKAELRPPLLLVQQVLEQLNVFNITRNPAQKALLTFLQSSHEQKFFPLSIKAALLEFYQTADVIPSESELAQQIQQTIYLTVQAGADQDTLYDISRYITVRFGMIDSKENLDEIMALIFPEGKGESLRKMPLNILAVFLFYFIDNPHADYADKLDQLFIQKLAKANSLQELGCAYHNLQYRMGSCEKSRNTIQAFLTQENEQLQKKVMSLYMADLQEKISPNLFIELLIKKYNECLGMDFLASDGICDLLALGKTCETAVWYRTIIESDLLGAKSSEIEEAAKNLMVSFKINQA